jgi:hypothetical protein
MAKGRNGRLALHNFHAAMGFCGTRTTYAFTHSGSLGMPVEFNTVTSITSGPIILGSAGGSGRVTRRAVPRISPTTDAVLFGVTLIGTHWVADFTRIMPVPDFHGNIMSACFFERKVGKRVIFNIKSHHEFFACTDKLVSKVARELGVKVVSIALDSDTTVFKTGSIDAFTKSATECMDRNSITYAASPPNTQARNMAEGYMCYLMAVMFSQIAHAKLAMIFWGLSILHAADVLNARPASDTTSRLPYGTSSDALYYGRPSDLSLYVVFGAMSKLKFEGTKSNQLRRQYRDALFIGIAWHCMAWRFLVIEDQTMTVSYHASINADMTARSSLLYRDGLAMNQDDAGTMPGIKMPANDFNRRIRELYAKLPAGVDEGIVLYDRVTNQPATMIPAYDENGDLVMHEEITTAPTPTPAPAPDTAPTTAPPPAPTPATPTASSPTRPPPKSTTDRLHALGDDVKIRFKQPCPKRPGTASAARYEEYMTCSTLGELRGMWPTRARKADYPYDYDAGHLTFENPTVIAFIGSIWSELLLSPPPDAVRRDNELAYVNEYFGGRDDVETAADTGQPTALSCYGAIGYYDSAWSWSLDGSTDWLSAGTPVSSLLYINKWGGGEPDGYTNNYIDYTNGVQHEMDTPDTIDESRDTAYISAMLHSVAPPPTRPRPTVITDLNGTWEAHMDEACEYDNGNIVNDVTDDDITARCESMKIAAAQIITDINGAGPEEYIEEESLINAVAESLDQRLQMLGTDAPAPDEVHEYIAAAFAARDPEYACSASSATPSETDPTFSEAMASTKRKEWVEACCVEWLSLTTTYKCFGTKVRPMSEAVKRHRRGDHVRIIPLRWVLKMKPSRLKARLVACESVGRYSTPRMDKWSPAIGSDSVRMVFVIGCQHNCDFFSLDISGAYLTGKRPTTEPDVYLTMPPGLDLIREYAKEHNIDLGAACDLLNYKDSSGKTNCLFLEGNLYGTQLAGRAFWEHARSWLVNTLGFKEATGDPCIFSKEMDDGSFIIVGLYVDDCLIATNRPSTREWFGEEFEKEFKQSPDSDGDTYLGIQYKQYDLGDYKYITLNTPRIWEKVQEKITGLKIKLPKVATPLPLNAMELVYADPDDVTNPLVPESEINVREILGMISWGVHAVRPGEAFATSLIARRAHLPTRSLVVVLLHLTSYLLIHAGDMLHIVGDGERIFTTACDSSFANDQGTNGTGRSWFGFALIWGGIAFHFRSKLQPYVAPSTRDAEAGALVFCVKAMIGTLVMLEELGFLPEGVTPLRLECDSQAAIASMTTEWIHKDSRWNAIRIRFLREFVREMLIKPFYMDTALMRADPLTKVPSSARAHEAGRRALMGTAPPSYAK